MTFERNKTASQLGLKVGDKVKVVTSDSFFKTGEVIQLQDDDGSPCPFFWKQDGSDYWAKNLSECEALDPAEQVANAVSPEPTKTPAIRVASVIYTDGVVIENDGNITIGGVTKPREEWQAQEAEIRRALRRKPFEMLNRAPKRHKIDPAVTAAIEALVPDAPETEQPESGDPVTLVTAEQAAKNLSAIGKQASAAGGGDE